MATTPIILLFLATGVTYQEPAKPPGWTTLNSPEGDFHVEFPARAMEQAKSTPSNGGTIDQKVYYVRAGGCLFTMQRFHYPRPFPILQIADRLDEQRKGYLQGNVELVRENDVTVNDVTGEQFEYKGPSPRADGTVTSLTRHFIKGSSYYAITVMSAPNQPLPRAADRFLESFHFAKAAPAKAGAMVKGQAKAKAGTAPPPLPDGTPEDALRSFMIAVTRRDEAALRAVTVPDRELDWLLRGPPPPAEVVEKMRTSAAELKFKRLKPGDPIKLPPQGKAAVVRPEEVTEDRAMLLPEGSRFPIALERIKGHWKVDARPIVAARKAADAARQKAQGQ